MTIRTILFCAGAALALSACGSADKPAATETAAAETAAAAATPAAPAPAAAADAATPAKGAAPTKEYLVGKWGENGDCELAIGFNADGTMDGPFERWELDGAELTMVGNPQKMTLSVIDKDTMESRRSDQDKVRTIKRC